ncbi:hypothetical protein HDU67_008671 [Dinochytrium kinnereticum]|nr:hypothetical protein HDU67_008671 [Dinochytrium kinnereticum]
MSSLTDSILLKLESLRQERKNRHESLTQDIDRQLSIQSLRSTKLLSSLEDALTVLAYKHQAAAKGESESSGMNEEGDDDVGSGSGTEVDFKVEGSSLQTGVPATPTRTPVKRKDGDAMERVRGLVETGLVVHAESGLDEVRRIAKEVEEVEESMRVISQNRIHLRTQFLKDLHRLDSLETHLTSISRSYETERRNALDKLSSSLSHPAAGGGGGKRKRDDGDASLLQLEGGVGERGFVKRAAVGALGVAVGFGVAAVAGVLGGWVSA